MGKGSYKAQDNLLMNYFICKVNSAKAESPGSGQEGPGGLSSLLEEGHARLFHSLSPTSDHIDSLQVYFSVLFCFMGRHIIFN